MTEACTFKTPEELGITQEQFNALVKVSGMLARGELKHMPGAGSLRARGGPSPKFKFFNMGIWAETVRIDENHCGTAGCLGGWAELASPGVKVNTNIPKALEHLFCPTAIPNWSSLTDQQGAAALCHYLKTGDDGFKCWNIALHKKHKKTA